MRAFREDPVPLADDSPRVRLGDDVRAVQNGTNVYSVSLNREYLDLLGALKQGCPTKHAVALRPVVVKRPAYIIQPTEVLEE